MPENDFPRSRLLYPTFDADIRLTYIEPKHLKTRCRFFLEHLWDEAQQTHHMAWLTFKGVAALEYELLSCYNWRGADLGGFYEIFDAEEKVRLLERSFKRRRKTFLLSGEYDYQKDDPNDSLNYRPDLEELKSRLSKYHLYVLESMAGGYVILAKKYKLDVFDAPETEEEPPSAPTGEEDGEYRFLPETEGESVQEEAVP